MRRCLSILIETTNGWTKGLTLSPNRSTGQALFGTKMNKTEGNDRAHLTELCSVDWLSVTEVIQLALLSMVSFKGTIHRLVLNYFIFT